MRSFLELFTMWRHTRLVVLTSVLAAIHAAALIPFKPIPILPGITEIRPSMVFPIVFSLLFGPAAAWGAAIGNTIADLFGSLGPGTLFGFVGNLLYGYLPYRIWDAWRKEPPRFRSLADWSVYSLAVVTASAFCALSIAWGVHLLELFPFAVTAGVILSNNILVGLVLGPPFLLAIQGRVRKMHLLYSDIAAPPPPAAPVRLLRRVAGLAAGSAASAGIAAGYTAMAGGSADTAVIAATTPFLIVALVASLLA